MLAALFGLLVSNPAAAQLTHTLQNGLKLTIEVRPEMSEVGLAVAYRVGQRDAPGGYAGLPHLAEHMAFRGTRHLPGLRGYEVIAELGGRTTASTHFDSTVYTQAVSPQGLQRALWVESDRMGFLVESVTAENLALEQSIVASELDLRRGPSGAPSFIFRHAFPKPHPYYMSPDEASDVQAVTLPGLQGFLQRHYRPDLASIAIVGPVDPKATLQQVKRYFGPIVRPSERAPGRNNKVPPPVCMQAEGSRRGRGVTRMLWRLPDPGPPGEAEVLSAVIEGQAEAALQNPAVSVSTNVWRWDLETMLNLTVKASGTSLEPLQGPLRRVLGELESRVSQIAVRRARDAVLLNHARVFESPSARASAWARSGVSSFPTPLEMKAGIQNVTTERILARARALSGGRPDIWLEIYGLKGKQFPREVKFHRTECRRPR